MFKNILVSGVKQLVENKLSKTSNQGGSQPSQQQSDQSNMSNYGGGYGQGSYSNVPQQGYPSGPQELNYSAQPHPSPYPIPSYPSSGDNIGFNVNPVTPYPGEGSVPYPGGAPAMPMAPSYGSGYPPAPSSGHQMQPQSGAYPPQPQGSYPQGGGYNPAAPAYPQQGGYNPAAPAYPQQGGYNPASPAYPQQGSYSAVPSYGGPQFGTGYGQQVNQGYGGQQGMWGNPSVKQYPAFNANVDAETLRKAMKGFGCDNNKVIQVLCARSNGQRQEIARAFKTMYGKDLLADLKSELHGDFEDLVLALMERPPVYDAMQLRKAMEGLGTRESVLIEIMTTRTNAQIGELRYVYRQMYGSDLEKDLIGETSGHFKRLLVSLCAGGRDESMHVDPVRANHDARKLYQAGEGKLGTDESTFNAILASQNYAQLRLVFDEYQKVCNRSIEQSVQSEFSGDIRDGLLAVCAVIRSKPAYFATLLHNSMKGFGTKDGDLIRAVVTRCEVDMVDIRSAFEGMYKQPLEKMIKGDCSGSYKDGLIALVRGN